MSVGYQQLIEATIQHLEDLKAQGARFINLSPETLEGFASPLGQPSGGTADVSGRPQAVSPPTQSAPRSSPVAEASASSAPAPLNREAKETAMAGLRARAMVCQKCPQLAASRKNVVFGVGDIHSPLMFVGEAPGADEDERGEPFVGKAGQLLTKIVQTMGFTRDTVYIANILKCRPDTPGQAVGNRKPTAGEMKTCLPYLLAQLDIIQPKVIVALGATAVEGLLGETGGITRLRGHWREFRGVPVMPTYHPAYLLRNEALSEKRKVWEDMLQVLQLLGRPVGEKQRNYFLKA
ncbi:MAG: uracil-DNA glycosylase [Verrucomicrobia bacterium]|nr:MAG: uracil-DNA glycosylase [Verrucomicrobiota bacterium]